MVKKKRWPSPPHRRLRKFFDLRETTGTIFTATQAAQKHQQYNNQETIIFTATQAAQK